VQVVPLYHARARQEMAQAAQRSEILSPFLLRDADGSFAIVIANPRMPRRL